MSTSAGEAKVCTVEQNTEDKLPFDTACRELAAAKLPTLRCPERLLMKWSLVESLCVMLERVQRGDWGGPPEAQHEGHSSGLIGPLPPGRPMDAACFPSPKRAPQSQHEEERPCLQPRCRRKAQLSMHLGNKSFLIPWQQGCLQSPCSNRAMFIKFLCTDSIHAWYFNSFETVKHSVMFLSGASKMGITKMFVQLLDCVDQDWAKIKYVGLQRFPRQRLRRREISCP